jgi:hypothetical protein
MMIRGDSKSRSYSRKKQLENTVGIGTVTALPCSLSHDTDARKTMNNDLAGVERRGDCSPVSWAC